MKKLLIHSQNTVLLNEEHFKTSEQFVFSIDTDIDDVDYYIHDQLTNGDLQKKVEIVDIVFIKVALSENYLEYFGLRIGYHIRLTKQLGNKTKIPIVFVAEESCQFIGLTANLAEILFTEGIYLMKDSPLGLHKYERMFKEERLNGLRKMNSFLQKSNITPPPNYQSHHSIANEWSILRWSTILELDKKSAPKVRSISKKIEALLYYKFILQKSKLVDRNNYQYSSIQSACKVLYIDDEWDKGWSLILKSFFQKTAAQFKTVELSYTDKKYESIYTICKQEVISFDPDIVILDLRLCDDDFDENTTIQNLSGLKILRMIKEVNPGIQVLIFSATNKIWNLLELQNFGADNFIMKESPEIAIENSHGSEDSIVKFIEAVNLASEKSFIKELIKQCKFIKKHLSEASLDDYEYREFIFTLKAKIEICISNLIFINIKKSVTIDIAFLSFYNFLESFHSYYLKEENYRFVLGYECEPFEVVQIINQELKHVPFEKKGFDKPSWSMLLSSLFVDYFKSVSTPYIEIKLLRDLNKNRNDFIHGSKPHFTNQELKDIVRISLKACSNLKD